ncbi:hypothetical protein Enr13x_73300 [Stieleria neptunia]|uniref:Uncharacterized protein n=1 Tax=Stieleria neptunia TaxID=2527979 RepID=A0A518I2U2_9BACT|nr:hypothetical protein [Stieleria neptunia]QDV47421.1 hypothetical protein Enr13x_73300 [Stieleria neptunia]
MALLEADAAMSALESAKPFDYDKANLYQSKLRQYVDEKNSLFPDRPVLFDVTDGSVTLPDKLADRIEAWMVEHPEYSPFVRTFAKYYLASVLADSRHSSMYRHIAECVIEGGDFYIETGMFYLRDAAAVSATVG